MMAGEVDGRSVISAGLASFRAMPRRGGWSGKARQGSRAPGGWRCSIHGRQVRVDLAEQILIGESFVGSGANAAHVNTVLGQRAGPVGTAWVTALATPREGFAAFVAIAQPGIAVVPPTLFVNKAAIEEPAHGNLTWGAAQAGVARGVARALEEGVIDRGDVAALLLIAAVWVNPAAEDPEQIYHNNATATFQALRNGISGGPVIDDFLAAAHSPFNPYFRST
jgi:5,6,7,8-tetrahydromethanopterin hydro-lyase